MKRSEKILNFDYAALQAIYWILSGIIFCFTTVYLQFKGCSNYDIGIIFAFGNIISFVLQPLVAGYIDRRGQRAISGCLRITALLSLLLMLAVLMMPKASLPLAAAYVIIIAGTMLMQPLCISLSFYLESWGCRINFSIARAIGSLFYALGTAALGLLVQSVSENAIPASYIIFSLVLGLITLLFSTKDKHRPDTVEAPAAEAAEKPSGIVEFVLENKRFAIFLVGCSLLYFTHSLLSNFMIEFIRNIGGDSSDLGGVTAIMALTEVPVMLLFTRLTRRFSVSGLLRFSVAMFTAKALLIYLSPCVELLYVAVLLQAGSFAIFVPASVHYVDAVIAKRNAAKGQASVTAVIAFGSTFSGYVGGLLLDTTSPSFTLLVGVIASAVGTLIALLGIQKTR